MCQGFDFKLKWFQITRSRKKYKESGQFEQKTPPFFVSSGERKNHCHLVCRTVMKTREFQCILKSTISRKWGGVGDWLPSLELWYSMHKWVWAVATNPCCWTWSYCAAGTRATLKKKTIQLSQNEQAASNFAAFSEIFASYSGFRFKTTQVYTSAACSSTTIVKHFDWA